MSSYKHQNIGPKANNLSGTSPEYGFKHISEEDKLRNDVFRSDKEKFQLFTKMLRRNNLFKKAVPHSNV